MDEKLPEHIRERFFTLVGKLDEANNQVTGIINVFPDYYEQMLSILNIVASSNQLNVELQKLISEWQESSLLGDDYELHEQVQQAMRTQDWVQKNYELAKEAIQKLSALEDVTLQFYDNLHPDVVVD
jgi:hypothetical protein